ncbi:SDR family oxidoreductase [Rhizobium sp. B21/90]|uniref:SDR family oxidoreductase n=1 Tax=Rhizobium sp. B21/90 TaxID=2819993 RepID=UPI001C5B56BA|nr:SDR family oxidoreductase [Rhizobium sp. B21/90]QYA04693.1 SDR family oxidoreductase [Rhizobium sp. B21/90]
MAPPLTGMRSRGWGRVVNISSLTVLGAVERTSYATAKTALVSFTRSWALELAMDGITVNAISPGPTETELFRTNNPIGSNGEERYLSAIPMGRFGRPEEVAGVIGFLLSDDAAFITGQTLHVDGGASIGRSAIWNVPPALRLKPGRSRRISPGRKFPMTTAEGWSPRKQKTKKVEPSVGSLIFTYETIAV